MFLVPWFKSIQNIKLSPMTLFLLFINLMCFAYLGPSSLKVDAQLEKFFDNSALVEAQAVLYSKFVVEHGENYSESVLGISEKVLSGQISHQKKMVGLSFRDYDFMSKIPLKGDTSPLPLDEVTYKYWTQEIDHWVSYLQHSSGMLWGLSLWNMSVMNYITYQFVHANFFHLFMNMFFLVLFGSLLEPIVGSIGIFVLYIVSGFIGALGFHWISGLSALPLIGASGSVSGLLGVVVALYWSRNLHYFYWILPAKEYFGFTYLPAWILLILFASMDLSGLLGVPPEFGGTAHGAHLSAMAFGLLLGLGLRSILKRVNDLVYLGSEASP